MGEIFDKELNKAKKLSSYNKTKAYKLYDDMATAYISDEFDGLDKSLVAVKTAKKALRAKGIRQDIIDDYFLQRSYLSKTVLRQLVNDSIYTDNTVSIAPHIENIKDREQKRIETDLIIDTLKSKPILLSALKRNVSAQYITQKLRIHNATILKDFYNKHKDIIDQ